MDFASYLFIIVALAYVVGGVVQCVKPMGLSEFTPQTAKKFRIVSICSCFVAAIGCVFVAMGTDNAVMSIVGCVVLVGTLIVEIICSRKLVLKNEPHPRYDDESPKNKDEEQEEYEPYEDEELEEIEDEARDDEDDSEEEEPAPKKSKKQID